MERCQYDLKPSQALSKRVGDQLQELVTKATAEDKRLEMYIACTFYLTVLERSHQNEKFASAIRRFTRHVFVEGAENLDVNMLSKWMKVLPDIEEVPEK